MASQGENEMERKIDPLTNQTISEVDRTSKWLIRPRNIWDDTLRRHA